MPQFELHGGLMRGGAADTQPVVDTLRGGAGGQSLAPMDEKRVETFDPSVAADFNE